MVVDGIKIFAGNSNPELANKIAEKFGTQLSGLEISAFSDGETIVRIKGSVDGKVCAVVQSLSAPQNKNLIELLIIADALKNNNAKKVVAVIPYMAYARQDLFYEGEPLTAKLVAKIIKAAGIDEVVTVDIHSKKAEEFFEVPIKNLHANKILAEKIAEKNLDNLAVVAPDKGGIERAEENAKILKAELVKVEKYRPKPNVAEIKVVEGDVEGKNLIIFDDMIDTGGTMVKNVEALKGNGANDIYICATHAILSGNAVEKLENASVKEVILTDTIVLQEEKKTAKIKVISVAELVAEELGKILK